ncbi:TPA: hypothetical protein ACOS34_001292 [Campylobacter jejuni]
MKQEYNKNPIYRVLYLFIGFYRFVGTVINEKEKRLINVYFCEKPIIDFFQNAEYEKELQYYGINEKDFIKTNI